MTGGLRYIKNFLLSAFWLVSSGPTKPHLCPSKGNIDYDDYMRRHHITNDHDQLLLLANTITYTVSTNQNNKMETVSQHLSNAQWPYDTMENDTWTFDILARDIITLKLTLTPLPQSGPYNRTVIIPLTHITLTHLLECLMLKCPRTD